MGLFGRGRLKKSSARPEGTRQPPHAPGPASQLGLETVRDVASALQIDTEWSRWDASGVTWWPHRTAQRIWANPAVQDGEFAVTRISVETDVFAVPIEDWRGLEHRFDAGDFLVGSSHWGWEGGVARLRASVYVHDEISPFAGRLLKWVALDQAVQASSMIDGTKDLAPALSGTRTSPDSVLNVHASLIAQHAASSAWRGEAMEDLRELFRSGGLLAMGDEEALTVELPYGERGGPALAGGTSNLLTFDTRETHPRLGTGLLMQLRLRQAPMGSAGPMSAGDLNDLEWQGRSDAHLLGSWSAQSGKPPAFSAFFPSVLAHPVALTNLAMSLGVRARWATNFFPR